MPVEVQNRRHSNPIPKGTEKLVERCLSQAGLPTNLTWVCRQGPSVKGTCVMKEFVFKRASPTKNTFVVRVKPGSNDTARILHIIPPKGVSLWRIENALRSLPDASDEDDSSVATERATTSPADLPIQSPMEEEPDPVAEEEEHLLIEGQTDQPTIEEEEALPNQESGSLAGTSGDMDRVRLILISLNEAGADSRESVPIAVARDVLRNLMGASTSIRSIGQVLRALERRGYLQINRSDSGRFASLLLTSDGIDLITSKKEDALPSILVPTPEPPSVSAVSEGGVSDADIIASIERKLSRTGDEIDTLKEKLTSLEKKREKFQVALSALREEV